VSPTSLRTVLALALLIVVLVSASCQKPADEAPAATTDVQLGTRGTVEVTAQLAEIPEGAIFKRDLYNYATILKYQVLSVQRGAVDSDCIYVGHYNPWKPRSEAADERVKDIGGNLRQFRDGQTHRLALEVPIDDFFMGGIVNKYFGQDTGPLYWAVWTDLNDE